MKEPQKSYYAIIPANVRYDSRLNPNAKLLYGEITALCNEKGFCWAGDKYFCELYSVSRSTVQRWFQQLEEAGYIKREVVYEEGSLKIKHRYTYLCDNPIPKNETTPIRKNETDNNTSFNTTVNTTNNKDNVGKPDLPYQAIIDYLNSKTGKSFKATSKATRRLIEARINEGFDVDDFMKVINNKANAWQYDKKMSQYLRPETLFGTKFEGYLNEKTATSEYDLSDEELESLPF